MPNRDGGGAPVGLVPQRAPPLSQVGRSQTRNASAIPAHTAPPVLGGALAAFPEAVLLLDASDRIWWGNRAAAALTGWPEAAFRGMPLDALIAPGDIAGIAAARGVPRGELRRYHCTLRTASGAEHEVSVAIGPAAAAMRLCVLRDLRRQREVERRLLARVEERADVEQFGRSASGAVHDLRNLVNLLGATVKNFRRHGHEPAFADEGLRTLEEIAAEAAHVLARLTTARTAAQPTTLDELVRRALDLLARAGRAAEVKATMLQGLREPLRCRVDVPQMLRVVMNVLLNAYDATRPVRGTVTVRGERGAGDTTVRLVVEDTGPGFAPEYLARDAFRPFCSTKAEGLGLGLYHCRAIVQAHGGGMEADNRAGGGARVVITLPAAAHGAVDERGAREAS